MTENLLKWLNDNKMSVSESDMNGSDIIIIDNIGTFLYLQPFDGKIIDEDFAFILSDEEFDILDDKKVNYILFEFGGKFYYSNIKKDKNRYNEIVFKPEFNDFKYLGKTSEPKVMDFVHLGVHSEYEMMNGSGACELWAKKASFMECKAVGICDKNTMAGVLSFQTACEKKGIKSIIGETVTVAVDYSEDKHNQETFELKFFILNQKGWKNLLLINKAINVDYNGFIPDNLLYTLGEGLCCVVPKESEFNYIKDDKKSAIKLISKYKKSFDKVYYQIDTVEYTSQQLFKKHLENIDTYLCNYRKLLKPIMINDSYYLDKEESELKAILNKVNNKATPESSDQYFKSVSDTINSYNEWIEDVEPLFEAIITGIENASKLSDIVDFRINTGERKLPHFEVKDVEELFFEELEKGINERLGHLPKKELSKYMSQIENECNVIVPNGLCDYFMILWDIIKWCHDNDINTGPGRGSVCGSLVAYCLHITDVDPLKYGLMFERFLNETRVSGERAKSADSMPDIDVDFPTEFRDAVKEYIKEKYGYAYTCSIGTYTRMKLKTCIKDFGKVKGLSFDLTNKLTKDIDDQIEYTWGDLIEYASKSKLLFKFVQENPELVHLTKYALLQPKAESVHPSAVVIVPKHRVDGSEAEIDLWEWMPVKKIDGVLVSEWEGKYIDKSGFLKEDILGLSQLDKFKSMLNLIKKNTGKNVNMDKIPLDDEETFKYFKRGWNEDVFQFGTNGLMNYSRQVKPDTLAQLIAMTALFRPGPMELNAHQDFADIKNGKKKPTYDFGMEKITEETFGLYVYQEQIMKAVVVGGLTEVESDILRTTIKKKDVKTLSSFGEKFKEGYAKLLSKNGIKNPEEYANHVWEKLLAFSGYGFNKCIDGDEIILKVGNTTDGYVPTIGEMYKIRHMSPKEAEKSGHYALRKKYMKYGYGMCFSLSSDLRLKRNKIIDIRFVGTRRCYKITTESGKSINVTMNHKFPTPNGTKLVVQLKVGDMLYCNAGYEETNKDYSFGIGASDNYPESGECGFQTKDFSVTRDYDEYISEHIGMSCEKCGKEYSTSERFEAHHIDQNRANNSCNNLQWLCNSCHKKVHYENGRVKMGEKGLIVMVEKIKSIEFVGLKEVYDVEVSGDISHTFLTAGGIVTSNSHAAAYSIMSYWSQWFKVNYPLEFWTTALQFSKEGEVPYRLAELKKTGVEVEVRPPDVNFSDINFTCEPKEQRIFFSLTKIKGVGEVAVKNIIDTRHEGGQFYSLEEFLSRVPSKVNKTVVKCLIVAGAFDLIEGLKNPRDRKKLLAKYLDTKGESLPEEYMSEDSNSNAFWILEQKRLTGFGEVDYENMIKDAIPNKRIANIYVNDVEFLATKEKKEVAIAGKLIFYKEKDIKTGTMCTLNIDCNNTIIPVLLWPDAYEKIGENIADIKGCVVAINGVVEKDTWRNEKKLFSSSKTKLYVLSETKKSV